MEKNEKGESVKSYEPVSFGSKVFNTAEMKMSIFCKEFSSLQSALETFSHFICGSGNPVLVLTDNKSLTRFSQAKTIPPSLWNYVDRVTAFNIVTAFYESLRMSLMLMRNHAEYNRVQHIRLPKLECGFDNLQWQVVHKILQGAFQGSPVNITVCFPLKTSRSEIKH